MHAQMQKRAPHLRGKGIDNLASKRLCELQEEYNAELKDWERRSPSRFDVIRVISLVASSEQRLGLVAVPGRHCGRGKEGYKDQNAGGRSIYSELRDF
jgi:hypothetical protein